jgi:hypothetical protein
VIRRRKQGLIFQCHGGLKAASVEFDAVCRS